MSPLPVGKILQMLYVVSIRNNILLTIFGITTTNAAADS